jgi:hypothetical protein
MLENLYGGNNAHNSILSLHLRTIGLLSHFLARCLWFYERNSTLQSIVATRPLAH